MTKTGADPGDLPWGAAQLWPGRDIMPVSADLDTVLARKLSRSLCNYHHYLQNISVYLQNNLHTFRFPARYILKHILAKVPLYFYKCCIWCRQCDGFWSHECQVPTYYQNSSFLDFNTKSSRIANPIHVYVDALFSKCSWCMTAWLSTSVTMISCKLCQMKCFCINTTIDI